PGSVDMIDPTLTASFAAISLTDLAPLTQQTWDPLLARDPRLLVPVDVRAIVVDDGETCEHALAGSSLLGATAPEHCTPPPFSDAEPRKAGVYLHWALPDGLTHGRAEGDASVGLRPLPDRWFIARIESGFPRHVRAWVVEAEHGCRTPLERWPGGGAGTPGAPPRPQCARPPPAPPPWRPPTSMPQPVAILRGRRCGTASKIDSQSTTTSPTRETVMAPSPILSPGGIQIPTSTRCSWHRPTPRSTT